MQSLHYESTSVQTKQIEEIKVAVDKLAGNGEGTKPIEETSSGMKKMSDQIEAVYTNQADLTKQMKFITKSIKSETSASKKKKEQSSLKVVAPQQSIDQPIEFEEEKWD